MKYKLFLTVISIQLICGCFSTVYYEGNYNGKVVDYRTLEPIEGAVVLGVWSKGHPGAGGVAHEYYDARETVTDSNGEFTIEGMGLRVMTYLEKMRVLIFKAGYEDVVGSWDSLKTANYYRDRVKWEVNKAIIPLDKWSMEQRRRRLGFHVGGKVPMEKQKMLREEMGKEDYEIR